MTRLVRLLLAFLLLGMSAAAPAQSPEMQRAFSERAGQLPDVLRVTVDESAFFAPSFLAAVPVAQVHATAKQLVQQHGLVQTVDAVNLVTASSGYVDVAYERSTIRFNLTLATAPPHYVIGLIVASIKPRGDTAEKLLSDLRALPGQSALLVQRLDHRAERPLFAYNAATELAIGSGFKLWILAEAARATAAQERRWNEVVSRHPVPALWHHPEWPKGGPITLHSLATLMISQSDNTATDTLLHALGRGRVEATYQASINRSSTRNVPMLSTLEAFTLKTDGYAATRGRWIAAGPRDRRLLLSQMAPQLSAAALDLAQFSGKPRSIDTVEWFASPVDMVATLDHLRVKGGGEALSILAVNPGIPPADVEDFAYVGYKGGSEIGVMAMNLLVKTEDGRWYGVSGSWNNKEAGVDQDKFVALVTRALSLIKR